MNDEKRPIDITKEFKRAERRAKIEKKWNEARKFASEHKGEVIAGGIAMLGVVGKAIHAVGRNAALSREQRDRNMRWYDASLGSYYRLRRKPKNRDRLEVSRRKNAGEDLGSILEDLGLLK